MVDTPRTSTWTVSAADDGARVDAVVGRHLRLGTQPTRRLCAAGKVRGPRGRLAAGDRVAAGDVVTVAEATWLTPVDAPLAILMTDADVVVVDKPAGLVCHPLAPGEADSVVHRLMARHPEIATASDDAREGGLLHRLDTGTSGCLAVARHRAAWRDLRASFDGAIKTYLALVTGRSTAGVIAAPIGHDPADRRRMQVRDDGAACRTTIEVLGVGRLGGEDVSLVRLGLHGGRRHQLRVHLAHSGHSLVGDVLYGAPTAAGFWLHARSLQLPGRAVVSAPLPPAFVAVLAEAGISAI